MMEGGFLKRCGLNIQAWRITISSDICKRRKEGWTVEDQVRNALLRALLEAGMITPAEYHELRK